MGERSPCARAQLCCWRQTDAPCPSAAQMGLGSPIILLLPVPTASLKAIPVS